MKILDLILTVAWFVMLQNVDATHSCKSSYDDHCDENRNKQALLVVIYNIRCWLLRNFWPLLDLVVDNGLVSSSDRQWRRFDKHGILWSGRDALIRVHHVGVLIWLISFSRRLRVAEWIWLRLLFGLKLCRKDRLVCTQFLQHIISCDVVETRRRWLSRDDRCLNRRNELALWQLEVLWPQTSRRVIVSEAGIT